MAMDSIPAIIYVLPSTSNFIVKHEKIIYAVTLLAYMCQNKTESLLPVICISAEHLGDWEAYNLVLVTRDFACDQQSLILQVVGQVPSIHFCSN